MASSTLDWVGTVISNGLYRVDSKLGEGGMGTVYKAYNNRLHADVVIKVPKRAMLDDPEFAKRFDREIRSLVQLQHPHIVSVLDVGEHDGLPIAVMQFLPGGDLTHRQVKGNDGNVLPMSATSLRDWLPRVAEALDYIHKQNYIHRDVKPANILFDASGNAYLSDFGVAKLSSDSTSTESKLTGTGMVMGTPEYMAPELIMGHKCDGRVDQYALAVTAHEVLCGRVPFGGATPAAILVNQTTRNAVPLCELYPDIPVEVSNAIMRGIAKDPAQRYGSCAEFAEAVCQAIGSLAFEVVPVTAEEVARKEAETNQSGSASPAMNSTETIASAVTKPNAQQPIKKKLVFISGGLLAMLVIGLMAWAAISVSQSVESSEKIVATMATSWQLWTALVASAGAFLIRNRWLNKNKKQAVKSAPAPRKKLPVKAVLQSVGRVMAALLLIAVELAAVYVLWNSIDMPTVANVGSDANQEERLSAIPLAKNIDKNDFNNHLGVRMAFVSPGKYRDIFNNWETTESAYWISETEVTVQQYLLFWQETKHFNKPQWFDDELEKSFSRNNHPITGISVNDAKAFCTWLTGKSREGITYRLPTLKEWVCAYRGGSESVYYWGDDFKGIHANSGQDASGDISPEVSLVGHYPMKQQVEKHPWNLFDISGNVWEMTEDGARGGSWKSTLSQDLSATGRKTDMSPADDLGFRIVAVPSY